MINENGEKISGDKNTADPELLLAEVRFFLKAFRKNPNDNSALAIAGKALSFVRASDSPDEVLEFIKELEKYTSETKSVEFIRELISIRNTMSDKCDSSEDGKLFAAVHQHVGAMLYNDIRRIEPARHTYRYLQVLDLLIAAKKYHEIDQQTTANEILDEAQRIYEEIAQQQEVSYFSVGKMLYTDMLWMKTDFKNAEARFIIQVRLICTVKNLLKYEDDRRHYRLLATIYNIVLKNEDFPFEQEKEYIERIIEKLRYLVEEENDTASKSYYRLLKQAYRRKTKK